MFKTLSSPPTAKVPEFVSSHVLMNIITSVYRTIECTTPSSVYNIV